MKTGNKQIEIVVDLETMGNTPGSVITAIGAVAIIGREIQPDGFYAKINPQSCIDVGMKMDYSTVEWWMKQPDAAREQMFTAAGRVDLPVALLAFSAWVESARNKNGVETMYPPPNIWGNDPSFDNTILADAYRLAKIPRPWKHTENRCFRTLRNLFKGKYEEPEATIKHHALHDALWEAKVLVQILDFIDSCVEERYHFIWCPRCDHEFEVIVNP